MYARQLGYPLWILQVDEELTCQQQGVLQGCCQPQRPDQACWDGMPQRVRGGEQCTGPPASRLMHVRHRACTR